MSYNFLSRHLASSIRLLLKKKKKSKSFNHIDILKFYLTLTSMAKEMQQN